MSIVLKNQGLAANTPDDRHAEVLKKAKSSFCKWNRTVYRSMYPNMKKWELDRTALAAWNSSPETEKEFTYQRPTFCRCLPLSINNKDPEARRIPARLCHGH
jgi:hypothetical protein